jgi:hypothetical protein
MCSPRWCETSKKNGQRHSRWGGSLLRLDTSAPVDLDAVTAWICDHV